MEDNHGRTPEELLKDSILALQVAVNNSPAEPIFANNLGLSFFESGNYEDARAQYENAIKRERDLVENVKYRTTENLSFYLKNLGLAYYQSIKPADDNSNYHENARACEEAMINYNEAIELNP